MRERTTWDPQMISKAVAKQAASARTAEDPRAMNQDHHKQQPSADKYVIDDPSGFGEDIHPSGGTWKAEMSGGEVKRNEIGMPEMRSDTFNHPEKTAALDEETVVKKASVCVRVAKAMLPKGAAADVVEDQAFSLMYMPDDQLIATHARLASVIASQEEEDDEEDDDADKEEQQAKQAGQLPPEFVENMEKKKEEAEDKKEQSKEASLFKSAQEQMMQMAQQMQQMQAQLQQMLQQAQQQVQGQQGQQQGQMPMAQQQEMVQQAQQEQMPMAQQEQMPMASDDMMIDQILQDQGQGQGEMFDTASDIELEPSMDIGETSLSASEDENLRALFAQDTEYQNALHAASIQGVGVSPRQASTFVPNTRTASTRTVGTRPTGGVSQLGGAAGGAGGSDVSSLSNLWQSAPDVKDVFR